MGAVYEVVCDAERWVAAVAPLRTLGVSAALKGLYVPPWFTGVVQALSVYDWLIRYQIQPIRG